MKLRALALFGAVTLAALTTALAVTSRAYADEQPLIVTEPFEEVFPNPCTGETVTLTGDILIISHVTEDSAGGFHEKFQIVPRDVTATGASGTQYRVPGGHSDSFNTGPGRATTFAFAVTFNVISKGGADNFIAKGTIHVTVNANGDVTAEFEEIRIECRG